MRFFLGPLCDEYGPRVLFMGVLCVASVPTALTGIVQSANSLIILRLFIGIAGGSFVVCQYWTSRMFTKDVVGTANALVAGWGYLGGGVTQLVMGSICFLYSSTSCTMIRNWHGAQCALFQLSSPLLWDS